eukprot:gene2013-1520_t
MSEEKKEGKYLTWKDSSEDWKKLIEPELKEFIEKENLIMRKEMIHCLKVKKLLDQCWEKNGKKYCENEFNDYFHCSTRLFHRRTIDKPMFIFPIEKKYFDMMYEKRVKKVNSKMNRNDCRNEIDTFVSCLENCKIAEDVKKCDNKKMKFCFENIFQRTFE